MRKLFIVILASILFLLMSLPGLYADVLNPDGINWHNRSENFTQALITGDYANTYQAYHPGVTLMWLSGPLLHSVKSYYTAIGMDINSKTMFLTYDYIAKISVVCLSSLLFFIILFLLKDIVSTQFLLVFSLLMAFEPFVIGQRRLYHLDFLMALFAFLAFIYLYVYLFKYQRIRYLIGASLFFSLGLLTKSLAVVLAPVLLLMFVINKLGVSKKFQDGLLFIFATLVFLILFFPALWENPFKSFPKIKDKIQSGAIDIGYYGRKEVGFGGRAENITLDETEGSKLRFYYPLAILYTFSPIALLLLLFSFLSLGISVYRRDINILSIFSMVSIFMFGLVMTIASKKGLRYGIVFFPFLYLIIGDFISRFRMRTLVGFLTILLLLYIPQYLQIYPYFYAYANPLIGGVKSRVEIFNPGSFGVGTFEVSKIIFEDIKDSKRKYIVSGNKSLKTISSYAKVETGKNCNADYIVIYHADMGDSNNCVSSDSLLKTVKVGNLDYWYIYKKT